MTTFSHVLRKNEHFNFKVTSEQFLIFIFDALFPKVNHCSLNFNFITPFNLQISPFRTLENDSIQSFQTTQSPKHATILPNFHPNPNFISDTLFHKMNSKHIQHTHSTTAHKILIPLHLSHCKSYFHHHPKNDSNRNFQNTPSLK